MTAGKVLIGGTAYDIKGGKTLIGGTAYDIKGGRTLIGGTGYNISFAPPREQSLKALLSDMTVANHQGRNASSSTAIGFTYSSALSSPRYILSFCNGYMSVNKVTWDGSAFTKTILYQASTSYGNIYTDDTNKRVRYSNTGESSTNSRATLISLALNNYTISEADSIFSGATYTRLDGHNSSSKSNVRAAWGTGTHYYLATIGADIGYSALTDGTTITNYLGTNSTNPSLLWVSSANVYLSDDGATNTTVYGGSLIEAS